MRIGKKKDNDDFNNIEVTYGSKQDMKAAKAEHLDEITQSIEHIFEDYEGGLVTIIVQKFDKNGKRLRSEANLLGIGTPQDTIDMAKAQHDFAHAGLDRLKDSLPPNVLIRELKDYLGKQDDAPEWLKDL